MAVCLVLTTVVVRAEVAVDPEITALEQRIESKLETQIKDFFGPDFKVLVNVRASRATPQLDRSPSDVDVGYVPLPVNLEGLLAGGSEKSVVLASLNVDISVPSGLDDNGLTTVRGLAEKVLTGLNAKLSVERLPQYSPPLAATKGSSLKEKLLEPDFIVRFVTILGAALLLTIGIALLAAAFRGASKSIAEGFQSIRTSNSTTASKPIEVDIKTDGGLGLGGAKKDEKPALTSDLREYTRNIKLIKQILRAKPILVLQAFEENQLEYEGIKKILPSLDEDEQEALKKTLGAERIVRLNQPADAAAEGQQQAPAGGPVEFTTWLQSFVERLMVKKVQGGSHIEQVLGSEKTLKFFTAPPESLAGAAKRVDDRGAWRVAAEFLPGDQFEKQLAEMPEDKWKIVMNAGEVTDEEITASADKMLEGLDQSPETSKAAEHKQKFYSSTLLNPVIGVLLTKSLDTVDAFLDRLETESPDFVRLVRDNVWTPRMLERVPDPFLEGMVKALNTDQKVALIIALPSAQSERVQRMVPEGNVKIIVTDMVKKARDRNDPKERTTAEGVCREFLDYLRRQQKAGKFQLADGGSAGATVTPLNQAAATEASAETATPAQTPEDEKKAA